MIGTLTQKLGNLIEKIKSDDTAATAQEKHSALDLSLRVMSLISVADGVVDDAEVRQVQQVYMEHAGSEVPAQTIVRAFKIAEDDQQAILAELRSARNLPIELRSNVFQAAVEVAASDTELHEDEIGLLKQIGTRLDLPTALVEQTIDGALSD